MKINKKSNIGEYLILLILLIMIVGMSFARPVFLSSDNLLNIARQISMVAIVGIGMTFVLIIGEIDLLKGRDQHSGFNPCCFGDWYSSWDNKWLGNYLP